jgi:hypothetical protein
MRGYGGDREEALERMARDLAALLGYAGFMAFLVFVAAGAL